jgi:hypothetical protein
MQIRTASSAEPAAWISQLTFQEATTFGPPGFEAYARLRFIPDPTRDAQSENEVKVSEDHPSDLDQARRALQILAGHTSTPDHCYLCIWDGFHYDRLVEGSRPCVVVDLPHRRYLLLEGPLIGLRTWEAGLGHGGPLVPPAFVWPADHAWIFVCDVDPHWAGIGAGREAMAELLDDQVLDIVSADPSQPQPYYF